MSRYTIICSSNYKVQLRPRFTRYDPAWDEANADLLPFAVNDGNWVISERRCLHHHHSWLRHYGSRDGRANRLLRWRGLY